MSKLGGLDRSVTCVCMQLCVPFKWDEEEKDFYDFSENEWKWHTQNNSRVKKPTSSRHRCYWDSTLKKVSFKGKTRFSKLTPFYENGGLIVPLMKLRVHILWLGRLYVFKEAAAAGEYLRVSNSCRPKNFVPNKAFFSTLPPHWAAVWAKKERINPKRRNLSVFQRMIIFSHLIWMDGKK